MRILGLLSTADLEEHRYKNIRSSVFYNYPKGAAPLTGLTSMLDEEDTDDPEFFWHEKSLDDQRSTLVNVSTTVVFTDGTTPFGAKAANFTFTKDTKYGFKVADYTKFRIGHTVQVQALDASGNEQELFGRIDEIVTASGTLIVRAIVTAAAATDFDGANAGKSVRVAGSAFAQGSRSEGSSIYQTPIRPGNFTQIFKTPFEITGTAAKVPLKYDTDGLDPDLAQEHALYHAIEIEKAFFRGQRALVTGTNGKPEYYTGGLLWYLREYEKQYSIYRGGNGVDAGPAAITADSDDDKRIIENTDGKLSLKKYNRYLERVFRQGNAKTNERLIFLGNGALSTIHDLYDGRSVLNSNLPLTDTFGMDVTAHRTPFGTVYYSTHPLFNQDPEWRNAMVIMDVHNLKYRYMADRDTDLIPNIEPNDADWRMDQWLTECGLEFNMPGSFMMIKNVVQAEV